MATRRLLLQRYGLTNVNFLYLGAYRLKIVASDAENTGADPNIFLFLRRLPDTDTGVVYDDFHALASPADMAEYPIGEPSDQTTYPFFRYHTLILDFRATALAEKSWQTIVKEVDVLLKSLDRLDQLVEVETVTVGTPSDAGNSASSTGSESSQSGATDG